MSITTAKTKDSISVDQIFIILRENPPLAAETLATLPKNEAYVVKRLYIDLIPYAQIADELHLTVSRVRDIRKSAAYKLRHPKRLTRIRPFLPKSDFSGNASRHSKRQNHMQAQKCD